MFDNRTIEEVSNPVLPFGQWLRYGPGQMVKPLPTIPPALSFTPPAAVTEAAAALFPELPPFLPSFFQTPTIQPDPQSLQSGISPCLSSTISPHTMLHHHHLHHHHHHASDHRRKRKDAREITDHNQQLLALRAKGVSYKAIRERLGLSEAESTLRGRLRTLTKPKSERLRQPRWMDDDVLSPLLSLPPSPPPKYYLDADSGMGWLDRLSTSCRLSSPADHRNGRRYPKLLSTLAAVINSARVPARSSISS